jgi:hypothetical protein
MAMNDAASPWTICSSRLSGGGGKRGLLRRRSSRAGLIPAPTRGVAKKRYPGAPQESFATSTEHITERLSLVSDVHFRTSAQRLVPDTLGAGVGGSNPPASTCPQRSLLALEPSRREELTLVGNAARGFEEPHGARMSSRSHPSPPLPQASASLVLPWMTCTSMLHLQALARAGQYNVASTREAASSGAGQTDPNPATVRTRPTSTIRG